MLLSAFTGVTLFVKSLAPAQRRPLIASQIVRGFACTADASVTNLAGKRRMKRGRSDAMGQGEKTLGI